MKSLSFIMISILLSRPELDPNKWYQARVLVRTEAGYPEHDIHLPWAQIKMPKVDHRSGNDNSRIQIHLSVFSEKPTDILVSNATRVVCYHGIVFGNAVLCLVQQCSVG